MKLTYGSLDVTAAPFVVVWGSSFGAPQNVIEALAFMLQDGEVELSDRTSNRTIEFTVLVEGANLLALATSEAALIAESEETRNTLTLDPEDSGPVTVFETFRAQVAHARDDDGELSRLRMYTVTVKALPASRSAAEVTAAALAANGTTTTLVDNGSATTNWTGTTNGSGATVAVVSGAVGVTTAALAGTVTIALTRTASITTSSTKYLVVDWKPASPYGDPTLRAYGDGTELPRIAQAPSPTAGFTRSWFYVAAASVAALRLDSATTPTEVSSSSVVRSLHIDNIDRTDIKPTIGTARQLLRSVDVSGSARTQGSLAVEHATSALGDVLVYCFPDGDGQKVAAGYSPPLRQYRVSGGTVTPDTAQVSGSTENLVGATTTFDIPVQRLIGGSHLLMARVATTSVSPPVAATVTWTASVRVNATAVGAVTTQAVALSLPSALTIFPLGRVVLPTVDIDPAATTAVVRITLTATSASGVTFDEGWLFNTSIGQLVQVACGTGAAASGGPAKRLFIEPAVSARPRNVVRIGHAADRSDSFYPSTFPAWQFPQFLTPRVNVLTVTTNALDASVTLRYFPRWHTHAAS